MARFSPRFSAHRLIRLLLLLVFLCVAAYAGIQCFLRPPEQTPSGADLPGITEDTVPNTNPEDAEAAARAAAEAEALRRHTERKENFYTILVSGIDNAGGGSDTNILLAVDAENDYIHGVSIPRDTKAYFNNKNYKINAAYGYGGMECLAEVVSDQLGIPVDYTVLVDLDGFAALIDAIGGVDFSIPIDMDYDDPIQDLSIHFTKGLQHLNGADALNVVRFRHNNDGTGYGNEDLGRMDTQQKFLKAVAKQTLTVSNLDKIDNFVKIFRAYVETDLTLGNLAWLGKEAISMGTDNISFSTLPGEWISPYIYLDEGAVLELVNTYLNPYVEARVAEDLNIPN